MQISLAKVATSTDGPQSISFSIADGNRRLACTLQTQFPTRAQAERYFRANWHLLEPMARTKIQAGDFSDGKITLVMI
jgi:hypothetical protein